MWFPRSLFGDPRLHFCGLLIILTLWFARAFTQPAETPCLSCPGHEESAGRCLCYHVPPTPLSSGR